MVGASEARLVLLVLYTHPAVSSLSPFTPPPFLCTLWANQLDAGTAEVFGSELARGKEYKLLSRSKVAVFTWYGCTLVVSSIPCDDVTCAYVQYVRTYEVTHNYCLQYCVSIVVCCVCDQ